MMGLPDKPAAQERDASGKQSPTNSRPNGSEKRGGDGKPYRSQDKNGEPVIICPIRLRTIRLFPNQKTLFSTK